MDVRTARICTRAEIAAWAPRTVVWAAGGTRRQAHLEGVADADYIDWALEHQLRVAHLIFGLGVHHLFMPILGPPQVREIGPYGERLFRSLFTIGNRRTRDLYAHYDIRVRAYGQQRVPGLGALMDDLAAETDQHQAGTLWYSLVIEDEFEAVVDANRAAAAANATSWDAMVQAFYREPVPPVEVFIGFGKPMAGYLLPPLLSERAHCYWPTFPSYMLNEEDLRTIFWDWRFARATWRADKRGRYDALDDTRLAAYYQHRAILGVGRQEGGFWYPEAMPTPPAATLPHADAAIANNKDA